jgi:hypothetical protein
MLTTGIDKLHLVAKEWEESGKVRWTENTTKGWFATPNIETGEEEYEQRTITKKYINDDSSGLRIDNDGTGLLVVFNPNRLLTKTHHVVTHPSQLDNGLDIASTICKSHGIEVDFQGSTLSQVDLCRQAEMKYSIEAYQPAFSRLTGSRLENVSYEKGYYLKNDNVTAVFYDKSYQAKKKYKVTGLPETLQRFEIRYKNARTISSQLKCNNLKGLKLIDVAECFNTFADKRVFNNHKQLLIFPHAETLGQYIYSNERNGLLNFVTDLNIFNGGSTSLLDAIIQTFGSLKDFKKACYSLGVSRQRLQKFIQALTKRDSFYQQTFLKNKVTPVDLIDELKQKYELVA